MLDYALYLSFHSHYNLIIRKQCGCVYCVLFTSTERASGLILINPSGAHRLGGNSFTQKTPACIMLSTAIQTRRQLWKPSNMYLRMAGSIFATLLHFQALSYFLMKMHPGLEPSHTKTHQQNNLSTVIHAYGPIQLGLYELQ